MHNVNIGNGDRNLSSKLRRSRGSTCPWLDLLSVSIAIFGHGISDGALQVASLG